MYTRITQIFTAFIIVMCLVFAYFMVFTELMANEISGTKRITFVIVLLAYAAYRTWRLKKDIQRYKSYEDDTE